MYKNSTSRKNNKGQEAFRKFQAWGMATYSSRRKLQYRTADQTMPRSAANVTSSAAARTHKPPKTRTKRIINPCLTLTTRKPGLVHLVIAHRNMLASDDSGGTDCSAERVVSSAASPPCGREVPLGLDRWGRLADRLRPQRASRPVRVWRPAPEKRAEAELQKLGPLYLAICEHNGA